MNADSDKRFAHVPRWWLIVLLVLVGLPIGIVAAQQADTQQSPATGHAQVTTQGISGLPTGEVVWRVVERTAKPRDQAVSGHRVVGFILATEEPVLLSNVTADGKTEDVARLAPGESYMVKAGTEQIRASLTDKDAKYIAIELVPADQADNTNGGKILYKSDPFTAPDGERDIDLVRNVLLPGEDATLPDTGQNVAILATEGAIDVSPAGGKNKTLSAGDGAVFSSGDLKISASAPAAAVGGVRAQFAMMTSSLQAGDGSQSAYVVAVIGPEIPPADSQPAAQPTESSAQVPTDQPADPTVEANSEPTDVPVGEGSIGAQVWNCPDGMTLANLDPGQCAPVSRGISLELAGANGTLTIDDATATDKGWQWSGLPMGTYTLTQPTLPKGYDTYFVPGSAAVGGSPESGYTITIDPSAPDIIVQVYNLKAEAAAEAEAAANGSIGVTLMLCPEGADPKDFDPASCVAATEGYGLTATAASSGTQFPMSTAQIAGSTVTWSDLPLDTYIFSVDTLPDGWNEVLWPDGSITQTGGTSSVVLSVDSPNKSAILYAFQVVVIQ